MLAPRRRLSWAHRAVDGTMGGLRLDIRRRGGRRAGDGGGPFFQAMTASVAEKASIEADARRHDGLRRRQSRSRAARRSGGGAAAWRPMRCRISPFPDYDDGHFRPRPQCAAGLRLAGADSGGFWGVIWRHTSRRSTLWLQLISSPIAGLI